MWSASLSILVPVKHGLVSAKMGDGQNVFGEYTIRDFLFIAHIQRFYFAIFPFEHRNGFKTRAKTIPSNQGTAQYCI